MIKGFACSVRMRDERFTSTLADEITSRTSCCGFTIVVTKSYANGKAASSCCDFIVSICRFLWHEMEFLRHRLFKMCEARDNSRVSSSAMAAASVGEFLAQNGLNFQEVESDVEKSAIMFGEVNWNPQKAAKLVNLPSNAYLIVVWLALRLQGSTSCDSKMRSIWSETVGVSFRVASRTSLSEK